jgi:hypothetical protein
MPTSKKSSKPASKTVSPTFKYKREQKVFFIIYHKNKPDDLVEAVVTSRNSEDYSTRDAFGRIVGTAVNFSYDIKYTGGSETLVPEDNLYPSFVDAAKAFVTPFLTLIK